MNTIIDVHKALDNGYSLIPVSGKVPLMMGYSDNIGWNDVVVTEESLDYWIERADHDKVGWSLLLGDKSSGVRCVDIDTDDTEIINRVITFLDIPIVSAKKGEKGFTFFFRLPEGENPTRLVYSIKLDGHKKPIVEVFLGNKHTVLPPSPHPSGGEYVWIAQDLLSLDPNDLPILSLSKIEMLESVVKATSLREAMKELPSTEMSSEGGRWSTITSNAGRLADWYGMDISRIANELVVIDREMFKGNQFFMSREKLGSSWMGDNDTMNATMWVTDFMKNILKKDPKLMEKVSYQTEAASENLKGAVWNDVIPFTERELSVYGSDFPLDILPKYLQDYFNDYRERLCMTPDGMVMSMLTSMGAVFQGKARIFPKGRFDDFYVRPNLFTMIVAPSGMKKDSMINVGMAFFNNIDIELSSEGSLDDLKIKQDTLISISKKRKKAIEQEDQVAIEDLTAQLKKAQSDVLSEREKRPTLRFQNGTTEKMYETCMHNQTRGLLFHQSEFTGLIAMMNKKGSESMRAFFLKLANGTDAEGFTHETISGSDIKIRKLFGSMVTACQTDALSTLLRPVRTGSIENDGFYQRFLYAFPRDIPMVKQKVLTEKKDYSEIQNLFWLAFNAPDMDVDVDQDAVDEFIAFEMQMQMHRMRGIDSALQSLQAKYIGTMPKIAFILQFMHEKKYPKTITKQYMSLAIKFMEWQKLTIEAFWGNTDIAMVYNIANAIILDLQANFIGTGDSTDKLRTKGRYPAAIMMRALTILERKNYIQLIPSKGTNGYTIAVNPRWLQH